MRSSVLSVLLCAMAGSLSAQSSSLQFHGFLTGRAIRVEAQPSWTEAGFGRFDVGAASADDHRTVNIEVAQLGADWTPMTWFVLHADGVARREPSGTKGRRAGLLQAYADLFNEHWRFRVGNFWLPTSRENTGPLWTSPYTITYSALNTWIGEEFRPTGADLQFSPNFYFTLGATAFRGSDTMGTELAARGWTFGNRLTTYGEPLPLPPPDTTTKPITHDLDHKNGYAERIRVQLPERAILQVAHIDNRAELKPEIDGQTPWKTRFNVIGASVGQPSTATAAAEWSAGSTTVGFPGGSYRLDFETGYVLLSKKTGAERWTVRYDRFSTKSHSKVIYDSSYENGHTITVAWLHDASEHLRTGLEYARVKGDRLGLDDIGLNRNTGGSTITVEVRYGF